MAAFVVTIDGPAASGKSTLAKLLAARISAVFLDTGAMYRAVTLAAMCRNVPLDSPQALLDLINSTTFDFISDRDKTIVRINSRDVTEEIRRPDVTANVKFVASAPLLRAKLVEMQRAFASKYDRIVTEGRDQGTVAFPQADVKFFMTADQAERARRRQAELLAGGTTADIENTRAAIAARDKSDTDRTVGPLVAAPDAIMIDTTNLSIEQVLEKMLAIINTHLPAK